MTDGFKKLCLPHRLSPLPVSAAQLLPGVHGAGQLPPGGEGAAAAVPVRGDPDHAAVSPAQAARRLLPLRRGDLHRGGQRRHQHLRRRGDRGARGHGPDPHSRG